MIQIDKNTSLIPSQASALTSDIVWIEERSVLLADGTQQKVLVPQLYLAQGQSLRVDTSGSIIAAQDVVLDVKSSLLNTGAIMSAASSTIQAGTLLNLGGTIKAGDLQKITTQGDLVNLSGTDQLPKNGAIFRVRL